jgi:hypothetical protein
MEQDGTKPASALGMARRLLEVKPELSQRIGGEDTLRKLLQGQNKKAARLAGEGRIDPFWPVY